MPHFWINFYQVRATSTITVKENERAIKYGQSRDVDNIGERKSSGKGKEISGFNTSRYTKQKPCRDKNNLFNV
jgi:hypothetical protein